MTFSLRPRRLSTEPLMLASVRTRVVSWKDAAEITNRSRASLGDAQQQRTANRRPATLGNHTLVLFAEAELVDLLLEQERRVADFLDLYPTQHLTDDGLNVLV